MDGLNLAEDGKNNCKECEICHDKMREDIEMCCCQNCQYNLTIASRSETFANHFITPTISPKDLMFEMFNGSKMKDYKSKELKKYYSEMSNWVNEMYELNGIDDYTYEKTDLGYKKFTMIHFLSGLSFIINFFLAAGKGFALHGSCSYSLFASFLCSCIDVLKSLFSILMSYLLKYREGDLEKYPLGKSRMESLGIFVLSILICCYSFFFSIHCIDSIFHHDISYVSPFGMSVLGFAVVIKLAMWIGLSCYDFYTILKEDSKYQVFLNLFSFMTCLGGSIIGFWVDSFGGVVLSFLICIQWCISAFHIASSLIGRRGPPELERRILYITLKHHPLIESIQNIETIHLGNFYYAKVDITFPDHLHVHFVHDICKSLQKKLEKIAEIEKAWVTVHSRPVQGHFLAIQEEQPYS